jgi:hypothetical protein
MSKMGSHCPFGHKHWGEKNPRSAYTSSSLALTISEVFLNHSKTKQSSSILRNVIVAIVFILKVIRWDYTFFYILKCSWIIP